MRKIAVLLLILLFSIGYILYRNNEPKTVIAQLQDKKVNFSGNQLHYRVYLLGLVPAAEATFEAPVAQDYGGRQVWRLAAHAHSLRWLSFLFKGSSAFHSYVDTQTLGPVLFKQEIVASGKPEINREAFYDQKNGIMTIAGVKRKIETNTQDPLLVIFNLRRMDLNALKTFSFNLNTNQKNYTFKGTVIPAKLFLNHQIHRIATIRAQIFRKDKNPYHRSRVSAVFLEDQDNIPILIKVFASGGLITAKLVDIK